MKLPLFNLLLHYISLEDLPRFANRQGVAGLLCDEIEHCGENPFDKRGLMRLSGYAQKCARKSSQHKEVITRLTEFYSRLDIKMFLFKGYSLSLLYPTPCYRPSTDIDIYLYGNGKDGDEILKEHNIPVIQHEDKHSVFNVKGVSIENHATFINVRNRKELLCVEEFLEKEALQAKEDTEIKNLFLPTPNFNAIFLPYHIADHWAGREASFRQLCDWAFFLQKHSNDVDWNVILELAKSIGFDRFFVALNDITIRTFDLHVNNVPVEMADKQLADRILADIMALRPTVKSDEEGAIKKSIKKAIGYVQNRERRKVIGNDHNIISSFYNQTIAYLRHVYGVDKRSIWDMEHVKKIRKRNNITKTITKEYNNTNTKTITKTK